MTKLLDEAIQQLRHLPEVEQDAAADALFAYISSDERHYVLRPDQVAEVRRIRDKLRNGMTRLATPPRGCCRAEEIQPMIL
jgi:hypothetical protein